MAISELESHACGGELTTRPVPSAIAPDLATDERKAYLSALEARGCPECPAFDVLCNPQVVFGMDQSGRIIKTLGVQPRLVSQEE